MKLFGSIVLILLTAGSCQYDPFASDMTTHKPKFKEVLGTYKFENQTVGEDSVDKLASNATILLNADSTFDAVDIPNFVNEKYDGLLSVHGKWTIDIIGGVDNGNGTEDEYGLIVNGVPESIQHISFTGIRSPYSLLITYGDPDEGHVMILKKN